MKSYNNNLISYHHHHANSDIDLTQREQQCLLHALKGLTAKRIAKLINISHRTVETHLENIRRKYGCSNKLELLAKILSQQVNNCETGNS